MKIHDKRPQSLQVESTSQKRGLNLLGAQAARKISQAGESKNHQKLIKLTRRDG